MQDMEAQSFAAAFDYPVYFTNNVFDTKNTSLVQAISRQDAYTRHKLVVFVDEGVWAAWPQLETSIRAYIDVHAGLELSASIRPVPGGERCKCDDGLLQRVYQQLHDLRVDRHSIVICIGGGAVLDLVGYAAATAHRGIRLVRLPTTVLAQNDAGIGVKNGVNRFGAKNFIGTFWVPFAVINDFLFLRTLGPRDRRCGIAEAIKVALIRDAEFFGFMETHREELAAFDQEPTEFMIRRCAQLHLAQITQGGDPFETGSARPLDYGHWSAHKIESMSDYELRHGEAVAIGIMIDARYAVEAGVLEPGSELRIFNLLKGIGFDLWHRTLEQTDCASRRCVLDGLEEFREHLGGNLTVTLPSAIGAGVELHEMDERIICESIEWLRKRWCAAP